MIKTNRRNASLVRATLAQEAMDSSPSLGKNGAPMPDELNTEDLGFLAEEEEVVKAVKQAGKTQYPEDPGVEDPSDDLGNEDNWDNEYILDLDDLINCAGNNGKLRLSSVIRAYAQNGVRIPDYIANDEIVSSANTPQKPNPQAPNGEATTDLTEDEKAMLASRKPVAQTTESKRIASAEGESDPGSSTEDEQASPATPKSASEPTPPEATLNPEENPAEAKLELASKKAKIRAQIVKRAQLDEVQQFQQRLVANQRMGTSRKADLNRPGIEDTIGDQASGGDPSVSQVAPCGKNTILDEKAQEGALHAITGKLSNLTCYAKRLGDPKLSQELEKIAGQLQNL